MVKRVYLPIHPGLEIFISRITPADSERSKRRNTTRAALRLPLPELTRRLSNAVGQPRPRQLTRTRAPGGAWAVITLRFAPDDVRTPAMRTTGNGAMSASGDGITWTVPLATLDRPSAAVTRSRTTWSPVDLNEVVRTCLPTLNTALLARAQANIVSGLA